MSDSSFAHQTAAQPFRVEVYPQRPRVRVVPVGEIDMATVGQLDARLRELTEAGFQQLVLDLRHLTFIDSTGLRLVMEWDAASRRYGIGLALIEGPPPVQRIFQLAGVVDQLPFRA